jgi:hypothetical protein
MLDAHRDIDSIDSLTPAGLFGDLPVLKLEFRVSLPPDAALPPFAGSAWRGVIGWELQRMVCPFDRRPVCTACTIQDHCPYFLLLEKKSDAPGLRESPKGYVFHSPFDAGGAPERALHITLFGSCTRFLPVLAQAVFRGERSGIGANRSAYRVSEWGEALPGGGWHSLPVHPEGYGDARGPFPLRDWLRPASGENGIDRVRFATPVRLRRQGQYLNRIDWPFYFGCLARRLEALHCIFHAGEPLGRDRWLALQERFADVVGLTDRLRWYDLNRYSNRQHRKVPMGGLMGDVDVSDSSPWLMDWLRAAAVVHAGKGAGMGLGKLEIFFERMNFDTVSG